MGSQASNDTWRWLCLLAAKEIAVSYRMWTLDKSAGPPVIEDVADIIQEAFRKTPGVPVHESRRSMSVVSR